MINKNFTKIQINTYYNNYNNQNRNTSILHIDIYHKLILFKSNF